MGSPLVLQEVEPASEAADVEQGRAAAAPFYVMWGRQGPMGGACPTRSAQGLGPAELSESWSPEYKIVLIGEHGVQTHQRATAPHRETALVAPPRSGWRRWANAATGCSRSSSATTKGAFRIWPTSGAAKAVTAASLQVAAWVNDELGLDLCARTRRLNGPSKSRTSTSCSRGPGMKRRP